MPFSVKNSTRAAVLRAYVVVLMELVLLQKFSEKFTSDRIRSDCLPIQKLVRMFKP